jgi:hypothetical protein
VGAAWDELQAIQADFRRSKSPAKRYRLAIAFSKSILRVHDAIEARLPLDEYLLARLGPSLPRLRRGGLSWEEARALRAAWKAWTPSTALPGGPGTAACAAESTATMKKTPLSRRRRVCGR